MMQQIARGVYLLVALGVVGASHRIVKEVLQYRDGKSQEALLIWFRAIRAYGLLLALNMTINIAYGGPPSWGLWLPTVGAMYLLYALIRFLRVVC